MASLCSREYEAVNIVDFERGRPTIKEKTLHNVLEKVSNLPLVIISMIGVARCGKSFLLNLYINYLTYLEQVRQCIVRYTFLYSQYTVYKVKYCFIIMSILYSITYIIM